MEKHTHSSEFMIPTLMSTCPIPCLKSSPIPSRMPKPSVRKHCFQNKRFVVLENIISSFSKIYWTALQGELLGNSPKQSWVFLRDELLDNSLENLPLKFLSQPFSFFFHVIHSHLLFWVALVHMKCIMSFHNNSC